MKRAVCIVFAVTLMSIFAAAQSSTAPDHARDEEEIKRVVAQFEEFWNRHEFSRTAELHTEDSVDVNVVGQRSTHTDMANLPPWFQKAFGGSTLHSTVIWIKFLTPDMAAVDVDWDMTGARCPDGSDKAKSQTYRKGLMSLIMMKQGGRWLIAVFHNMDLPVVPPGSTETASASNPVFPQPVSTTVL